MADSPIIEAIAAVLGVASQHLDGHWCDGPGDERFFFADYRRNEASFKSLWALGGDDVPAYDVGDEFLNSFKGKRATIILVDQDSTQPVIPGDRLGRFVGALTWAHAFLFALDKRQHNPLPRIGILDLRGRNDTDAWAYSRFRTAPGISYFRGVGEMDAFTNWLGEVRNTSDAYRATPNSDFSAELDLAFRMWSVGVGWSNERAGHHEINNVAGPLALAVSCPYATKREILNAHNEPSGEVGPRRLAAAAMMRAFDWFGEYPHIALEPRSKSTGVEFMLLDDQYRYWNPVLRVALGTQPKNLVNDQTSPGSAIRALLDVIQNFVTRSQATGQRKPLRGKIHFSALCEVLFLDLRLFSKEQSQQEAELLSELVNVAKLAQSNGVLCRNDIDTDLHFVDRWLHGGTRPLSTEAPEYLRALSLLPQLLASLDDTYPIILFSSTRQRVISDRLKPYNNIIQCLPKPSFSAYSERHIAQSFLTSVEEALSHARGYLRLRERIRELSKLHQDESVSAPQISPEKFVEVFFDEAAVEDRIWVQAALIVEYKTDELSASESTTQWMRSQEVTLADAQGRSRMKRIRWGSANDCLDKKLRVDETEHTAPTVATWPNLDKILAALQACPHVASLHLVTLRIPKNELTAERRGYIDGCDPNFYASLRLLTECILFDLLHQKNKVALRFATRILKTDANRQKHLERDYGFSDDDFLVIGRGGDQKIMLKVLPSRVAHGIVDSCRQIRPVQVEPEIVCCDARQLNITQRCPHSEASSELHHLADLFATRALDQTADIEASLTSFSGNSRHLAETSYKSLEAAARVASKLQSARAHSGSRIDAWKQFFDAGFPEMRLGSIGRIIVNRLADSLCELEANEIGLLASTRPFEADGR